MTSLIPDRIGLQEPSQIGRISPRLVVIDADLGDQDLAGVSEVATTLVQVERDFRDDDGRAMGCGWSSVGKRSIKYTVPRIHSLCISDPSDGVPN